MVGEVIHIVGALFPGEELAKLMKQPEGKHRTVFYALCQECSEKPDAVNEVEDEFIKSMRAGESVNLIR